MNISSFLAIRFAGNEKYSSGISIASIGFPAVTFPSNGTSTIFSSFSKYSFGTNISNVLFLLSSFLIYPFSSSCFRWKCIVAGDDKCASSPISLTVGG